MLVEVELLKALLGVISYLHTAVEEAAVTVQCALALRCWPPVLLICQREGRHPVEVVERAAWLRMRPLQLRGRHRYLGILFP